jgi:hypothetical protein
MLTLLYLLHLLNLCLPQVPDGAQWWRRASTEADENNDGSLPSLPQFLLDMKANQDAYEAKKAKQEAEHRKWRLSQPFQDEMDELARTMDTGIRPNYVLYVTVIPAAPGMTVLHRSSAAATSSTLRFPCLRTRTARSTGSSSTRRTL